MQATQLQVIEGGRPTSTDNWLQELPISCVFLSRIKTDRISGLNLFQVTFRSTYATLLTEVSGSNREQKWVETTLFSKLNHLIEIIYNRMEEVDQRDRTNPDGGLDDNANAELIHQVDEE